MSRPAPSAPVPEGAVCHAHADAPAVSTCARCGVFVCEPCRTFYDYRPLCEDCLGRRAHRAPASPRARWAMICGLLGLALVVLPFGIPAVIMGHGELAAIARGTAPEGGRGYARAGVILGWLANFFFMVFAMVIAFFVATLVFLGDGMLP